MNPPPAEGLATRLFLGPALRTQPDRRLVTLVRDGYDTAFEEIVRRYGKALARYAGAIVGGRSEDVTQDAFSKALLALRRDSDAEIDLKPWLYRIVRNTALNDLRDQPPDTAELNEALGTGSRSAAEEAERREEIAELMRRLRDLPEPQRAAIVMRELEGLSHDEIASALGLSGGGARQTIYRARQALRDGLGLLVPLPLVRALIEHGGAAEASAAAAGAGGAAAALGGAGASAGAGTALKVGVLTAVLAGSVGTGLAIKEDRAHHRDVETAAAATVPAAEDPAGAGAPAATVARPDSRADAAGDGGTRDVDSSGAGGPGIEEGEDLDGDEDGPGPSGDLDDGRGHSGPGPGGRGPGPGGGDRGPRQPGDNSGPGPGGGPGPGIRSGPAPGGGPGPGGDGTRSGDGGGPGPSGGYLPPPPPPEGSTVPPPPDNSGPGSFDDRDGSSGPGGGELRDFEAAP